MSSKKLYPTINYTSRDFNSIKNDLVNYAKRYYPNTFQDFNEAGFGALMLDTVSYVGDILSYYVDYNANESFLDTAIEYKNILKLGKQMGFQFSGNPSSSGIANFFIIVPANSSGLGPDTRYMPILKSGTALTSNTGALFVLSEDVMFSDSKNEIVVSSANETTGVPTFFAIKASGVVVSGEIKEEIVDVGNFEKFRKIELSDSNITEVIACYDAEGHEYFRVDHLSQDVVFATVTNRDESNNNKARSILKPIAVPRRFTSERQREKTIIQFGFGSERNITQNPLIDPSTSVLDFYGKNYVTDTSFDPTNLLGTDKLGVSPANTQLTIVYRLNTSGDVNVGAGGLNGIASQTFQFENLTDLNAASVAQVESSLEVSNDDAILGDVSLPSADELKIRIGDSFASQNRAVTAQDYRGIAYQMPPQFGAIKRISVMRDLSSSKRNINLFVISEDENTNLESTNMVVKQNLKTWLNRHRMINDTIDILDAKIVNIRISFSIVADIEANKYQVLNDAIASLSDLYTQKSEIGEPFSITEVYSTLNSVPGVIDTTDVSIGTISGGLYSNANFDMLQVTSPDGRTIMTPENVILEIKYPSQDIVGSVL